MDTAPWCAGRCLPPGRCLRVFPRVDGTPVCISSFVLSSSLRSVSASLLLALFSPVPFRPILPPWCSNRFLVCPLRTNALFGTSPLSSPSHTRPTAVLGAPPLPFASPTRFRCLWSRPPPTQSHKNQPNRTPCPPLPPPPSPHLSRGTKLQPPPRPQTTLHPRCIDFLREKAECVPPSGVLSEAEEAAVSRSLELVRFLLENFHSVI